jgi:hypothetical protein
MNLRQICYSRLGRSEAGSGYQIVGQTEGTSEEDRSSVYSLLSAEFNIPGNLDTALAVQLRGTRAVFLCYPRRSGVDEFQRPLHFASALIIDDSDYIDLLMDAKRAVCLSGSNFLMSIPAGAQIGKPADLHTPDRLEFDQSAIESLEISKIRNRYGLDDTRYANLLKGVYTCLLSTVGEQISIGIAENAINSQDAVRDLVYCIYLALPVTLRAKLTYANSEVPFPVSLAVVPAKDCRQSHCWFDLTTGEYRFPEPLMALQFTDFIASAVSRGESDAVLKRMDRSLSSWGFKTWAVPSALADNQSYFYSAAWLIATNANNIPYDDKTLGYIINVIASAQIEERYELDEVLAALLDKASTQKLTLQNAVINNLQLRYNSTQSDSFIIQYIELVTHGNETALNEFLDTVLSEEAGQKDGKILVNLLSKNTSIMDTWSVGSDWLRFKKYCYSANKHDLPCAPDLNNLLLSAILASADLLFKGRLENLLTQQTDADNFILIHNLTSLLTELTERRMLLSSAALDRLDAYVQNENILESSQEKYSEYLRLVRFSDSRLCEWGSGENWASFEKYCCDSRRRGSFCSDLVQELFLNAIISSDDDVSKARIEGAISRLYVEYPEMLMLILSSAIDKLTLNRIALSEDAFIKADKVVYTAASADTVRQKYEQYMFLVRFDPTKRDIIRNLQDYRNTAGKQAVENILQRGVSEEIDIERTAAWKNIYDKYCASLVLPSIIRAKSVRDNWILLKDTKDRLPVSTACEACIRAVLNDQLEEKLNINAADDKRREALKNFASDVDFDEELTQEAYQTYWKTFRMQDLSFDAVDDYISIKCDNDNCKNAIMICKAMNALCGGYGIRNDELLISLLTECKYIPNPKSRELLLDDAKLRLSGVSNLPNDIKLLFYFSNINKEPIDSEKLITDVSSGKLEADESWVETSYLLSRNPRAAAIFRKAVKKKSAEPLQVSNFHKTTAEKTPVEIKDEKHVRKTKGNSNVRIQPDAQKAKTMEKKTPGRHEKDADDNERLIFVIAWIFATTLTAGIILWLLFNFEKPSGLLKIAIYFIPSGLFVIYSLLLLIFADTDPFYRITPFLFSIVPAVSTAVPFFITKISTAMFICIGVFLLACIIASILFICARHSASKNFSGGNHND